MMYKYPKQGNNNVTTRIIYSYYNYNNDNDNKATQLLLLYVCMYVCMYLYWNAYRSIKTHL